MRKWIVLILALVLTGVCVSGSVCCSVTEASELAYNGDAQAEELAGLAHKIEASELPQKKRNKRPKQEDRLPFSIEQPQPGILMQYEVLDNGDTVFVDVLDPVYCFPKGRRMKDGDWRRYYKLVYNFNKVYPYALVGREMMKQVDVALEKDVTKRSERNRYIKDVERELFRIFEKDIRQMTITQGFVLMRLVDRECGLSAYEIIQTYENDFAANFWQIVARLFSHNLKTRYNPSQGEDAKIEELCKIWDSGQWDAFYYSIFLEEPSRTIIKQQRLESEVKHR